MAKLSSFLSQTPAAICLLRGPDFIFEFASEGFKKIAGDRLYLGRSLRRVIPELRGQKLMKVLEQVYETGQPASGSQESLLVRQSDGQLKECFYDYEIEPCFDAAGRVEGLIQTAFDVTEEVRAKQGAERLDSKLRSQRRNFLNLFQQTPEMLCVVEGPEHRFLYVNESYVRALGFNAIGRSVREAQPESTEIHGLLDRVFLTGETARMHEFAVTIRGERRFFNMTFAARRDVSGQIEGVMVLGIEVTNEVLYREKLRVSEEQLKFALSSAQMGAWTIALPTNALHMPEDTLRLFGLTRSYTTWQEAVEDLVHPEDQKIVSISFNEATRTGQPFELEYRIIPPGGQVRWVQARGRAHLDNVGRPDSLMGVVVDISERKVQQEALRLSEERMKYALSAAHIGAFEIDLKTRRCVVSPTLEEILGHKKLGGDLLSALHRCLDPHDAEQALYELEAAIRGRRPFKEEYCVKKANGSRAWVQSQGDAFYDDRGTPVRFYGVVQDISERKRFERDLSRAKEEAIRANDLKSAFLANTSHEIRTPLGSILGFTELMKDPAVAADEKNAYLDIISRNGEQLTTIINDVLDLSKVEAGEMTIELLKCSPRAILEEAADLMSVRARDKNLEFTLTVNNSVPETIGTDPVRLRQIVVNLLSNSIKFTTDGFVSMQAWFERKRSGGGRLIIEVCDTGIGMGVEQQRRLFKTFVQGDESITRKYGGTGLGLSLSKRLAEALHGSLGLVRSAPGQGAVFRVEIPDQIAKAKGGNVGERSKKVAERSTEVDLSDVEVLLVEDSLDSQNLVSKILTRKHVHVTVASNGLEGIEKATSGNFDLVLMDVQMPVMDGFAATQKLRERGYRKPIIALTAHAMSQAQHRAMDAGCSDYLAKPINSKDLLAKVAFYASHRRGARGRV
jgi:PAS domain S-box-containing protein